MSTLSYDTMPSKAFPFPIGIGIDLIQTSRIENILKDHYKLNRWAQRVFTRSEWPFISHKCQQHAARLSETRRNNFRPELILPQIWQNADAIADAADPRALPPLTYQLLRLLAGRWAMKEAVIKAHRNRKLYMNEISVIQPERDPNSSKPLVLIDPPSKAIMMDARVASLRGLRETKYEIMDRSCLLKIKNPVRNSADQQLPNLMDYSGVIYKRRALVKEGDRQMAEGNISHDSEYAVAVCMAFDEKFKSSNENIDPIFDDGSGKPLHEPAWGDEGFLG